jgi:hypothetical protein
MRRKDSTRSSPSEIGGLWSPNFFLRNDTVFSSKSLECAASVVSRWTTNADLPSSSQPLSNAAKTAYSSGLGSVATAETGRTTPATRNAVASIAMYRAGILVPSHAVQLVIRQICLISRMRYGGLRNAESWGRCITGSHHDRRSFRRGARFELGFRQICVTRHRRGMRTGSGIQSWRRRHAPRSGRAARATAPARGVGASKRARMARIAPGSNPALMKSRGCKRRLGQMPGVPRRRAPTSVISHRRSCGEAPGSPRRRDLLRLAGEVSSHSGLGPIAPAGNRCGVIAAAASRRLPLHADLRFARADAHAARHGRRVEVQHGVAARAECDAATGAA